MRIESISIAYIYCILSVIPYPTSHCQTMLCSGRQPHCPIPCLGHSSCSCLKAVMIVFVLGNGTRSERVVPILISYGKGSINNVSSNVASFEGDKWGHTTNSRIDSLLLKQDKLSLAIAVVILCQWERIDNCKCWGLYFFHERLDKYEHKQLLINI